MNVSLTSVLEEFVRRKVATGLYNNASEVIREALRSMIERETGGKPAPKKSQVVATLKALEPELRERGISSAACSGLSCVVRRGLTAMSTYSSTSIPPRHSTCSIWWG